ncbi:hypothetical protein FBZ89_10648 [Nitrospirillum amazonense]|uniref:Uncharacterized protein n=1 Tax=Nitrospirillum amazonense TaxID=28077 RepID=A0A560FGC7_9PROT|nr:hypothetical protein [Nitrospirillum amazonense]TWB20649.1 hypothetical protein FBZ89_10648 [Nitrospirillum amazonense]
MEQPTVQSASSPAISPLTAEPRRRRWLRPLLVGAGILGAGLLLSACATQPPPMAGRELPGFLYGLLHGLIAPFSFLYSLISDTRVYAYPNPGRWYDFGFLLGVSAWGSGGTTVVRR